MLVERAQGLRFRMGSTPALESDLSRPHVLVSTIRSGLLRLDIDGLTAQVQDWISRHPDQTDMSAEALAEVLLIRQLTHALMNQVDSLEGWSSDPAWTRLSGWTGVRLDRSNRVDEQVNFANRHGVHSSREDLATLAEYMDRSLRLPGDPALDPRCRLRSKWRYLESLLGPRLDDSVECGEISNQHSMYVHVMSLP